MSYVTLWCADGSEADRSIARQLQDHARALVQRQPRARVSLDRCMKGGAPDQSRNHFTSGLQLRSTNSAIPSSRRVCRRGSGAPGGFSIPIRSCHQIAIPTRDAPIRS